MALPAGVVSCDLINDGRKASAKWGGSYQAGVTRSYTQSYRVVTADPAVESYAVGSAPGVLLGYPCPLDPYALCVSVEPRIEGDDPTAWVVTCEYTSDLSREQKNTPPDDGGGMPALPIPELSIRTVKRKAVLTRSVDDKPKLFVNSAGQAVSPAPEADRSLLQLVFSRSELNYSVAAARPYLDTVNKGVWNNQPEAVCKIDSIDAQTAQQGPVLYWRVTYTISVLDFTDPDFGTWDLELLDAGTMVSYSDGTTVRLRTPTDPSTGRPFSGPFLLDGGGSLLNNTGRADPNGADGGAVKLGTFQVYRRKDWAPLNIKI